MCVRLDMTDSVESGATGAVEAEAEVEAGGARGSVKTSEVCHSWFVTFGLSSSLPFSHLVIQPAEQRQGQDTHKHWTVNLRGIETGRETALECSDALHQASQ